MIKLEINNQIATVTFDKEGEKVNVLSIEALDELSRTLDNLEKDTNLKAAIFRSAKEGNFIAGADIKQIQSFVNHPEKVKMMIEKGHQAFERIALLPFPTFALIQGVCLGGGLELALSCCYRFCTDHSKVSMGLPEVNLGIFPGWGGTQRLPRLVGLSEGLKMILSGAPVNDKKGLKIGLVDEVLPEEFLSETFPSVLKRYIEKAPRQEKRGSFWLDRNCIGRELVFYMAKREVLKKTKGQYPAPLIVIELVKKTYTLPLEQGLKEEEKTFIKEFREKLQYARHLIPVFLSMEHLKKRPVDQALVSPVRTVGIIGAGAMGGGIAWLALSRGLTVRMKDVNLDALFHGYQTVYKLLSEGVSKKKITRDEMNLTLHRLSMTTDETGFQDCDLIIEAATENLELKRKIFHDLEKVVSPTTILATNTSSLTVKELSEGAKHPERFVGLHFFNPVNRMPLIEVVKGEKTSDKTAATVLDFCKKMGKVPLIVRDCHGFLVNRIFAAQANEVFRLLEEGASMEQLEKVLLQWGMPMGPFELADYVGNDVSYKVFKVFEKAYGARMEVPSVLERMIDKGFFGKKCGKGFYLYGKKKVINPDVKLLLPKGVHGEFTDEEIIDRVLLAMLAEAGRCVEEKVVETPQEVDIALVLGIGFPPYRGGIFAYANDRDIGYLMEKMEHYTKRYGERFKSASFLTKKAEQEHNLTRRI